MMSIEALKWRYATKKFDNEKFLPTHKLEVLKDAFNLTATSYGLQPIKMIIIHDKGLQEKLVKHSYNQKQVATASHVLVICIEKQVDKTFIEEYFNRVHSVRATPPDVLRPFQNSLIGDFEKKHVDEIAQWATNQAYLALGTLLTVCATEGIDSCPMEGFDPAGYDELLGLGEMNLESVLALPVGYRASDDMFSEFKKVRRPLEDVIIEFPVDPSIKSRG
ncbi:NAD(P)H-dependent oxidoreductase [Antarcticibacterium flavum]|uniref:NAD(P)H-dependent oxidoreductase n=1 Tax=Antarcticibacterium flavum TaxID=2058175 RepID=A0A5B7X6Y9_9FLAO|nr:MULTISPECIES: NAD(P)H-dependent oxidoreductase [Antarcticibacterium]MCM4159652.1 NAD(P)H-dependent oxidoreductase [Antarcticibacterium sp. W02-3]QCY70895.1 NAD(P)H-dependent oxidoreductase [Antarcticibacterium flavum]